MNVLLLDDSATFRKIINKKIKESSSSNHNIHQAKNNSEAINIIENENINLIIMDHDRPGGTGFDLFKKMKDKIEEMNIQVVVFTSQRDHVKEYKKLGITKLFSKTSEPTKMMFDLLQIIDFQDIQELDPDILELMTKISNRHGYEIIKKND